MKRIDGYGDFVIEGVASEVETCGQATADMVREAMQTLSDQMDRYACPEMKPTGFILIVRPVVYESGVRVTLSKAYEADEDAPPRK